jgi:benzoyl-CoA reductase/2-hydroxyglutaryl-CoA dehydratase subunit BcrC/BadD/HgdB
MEESKKTIAYTCPYVPAEWIAAHGLRPWRLIPLPIEGASVIPRMEGLCPYARAFVNDVAAREDVGGVIVTTMCDQMRRVFDLLVRRVPAPAFLLNVPSTWQTVAAQRLYLDELKRLGRFLVRLGGHTPDREELMRVMLDPVGCAVHTSPSACNENGVHSTPYCAVSPKTVNNEGLEFRLQAGQTVRPSFSLGRLRSVEPAAPEDSQTRLKAELRTGEISRATTERPPGKLAWTEPNGVPVAVVGGPLMRRDRVLFEVIEECGGRIVLDATETGQRGLRGAFDGRQLADDPLLELAQTYFRIPDVSRRPNSELYEWLKDELGRSGAHGIIFHHYLWCDSWRAEFARLKEWAGLPVLDLDSEGDGEVNLARLRSRVRAFMEMLQ